MRGIFRFAFTLFYFPLLLPAQQQVGDNREKDYETAPFFKRHREYIRAEQEIRPFNRMKHDEVLRELMTKWDGKEGAVDFLEEGVIVEEMEVYEDEVEQTDYTAPNTKEDVEKVKYLEKEKDKEKRRQRNRNSSSGNFNVGWLKTLLWIVLIILVAYVIYAVFVKDWKHNPKLKFEEKEINPVEIPISELERMLAGALADKNYREAIRIYFLYIIKLLIEKGWINWERRKTNMHYLREMSDKRQYPVFTAVVSIFEITWYGKRQLTEEDYLRVELVFKTMVEELEKGHE